jgi:predicted nucleic acid-binding Zn ribbon protein
MKPADEVRRSSLPRPLREILNPAVERLATSERARAFVAWTRAAGAPVAGAARPTAFFNGMLTIECSSSVWANELTYLGMQILARMEEVAPGQPVKRLRFVVGRAPQAGPADAGLPRAERPHLSADSLSAAVEAAEDVRDERLREAIRAALRASAGES